MEEDGLPFVMRVDMTDEQEGIVVLFPENFPDWALTPDERQAKRRFRPDSGEDSEEDTEKDES
jgi:hypothetical protein